MTTNTRQQIDRSGDPLITCRRQRAVAMACAAAAALLWGTFGPAVAAFSSLEPAATAAGRSGVASVALGCCGLATVRKWRPRRREAIWLLVGGVGLAGFQYAYCEAIPRTGVAISTAIAIGMAPVFVGGIATLRSRPTTAWIAGTLSAIIGLMLVLFGPQQQAHGSVPGIVWAITAAAMFSLQIIAIEAISKTQRNSSASLTWMFAISAAMLAPAAGSSLIHPGQGHSGLQNLLLVLYLGVITAGLAYWLFARGTTVIGASLAATTSLLEPCSAACIAVVFLGERQTTLQWVGMFLLLGSIVVTMVAHRPPPLPTVNESWKSGHDRDFGTDRLAR